MREFISLRRAVSLGFLLLAACGRSSAQLVPQLCPETVNDGGAAAALAMALAYHGHPVSQDVLRQELWNPDGSTDALKMVQSARAHGLRARGVKVEEKGQLDQVPIGSIVHRKDDRFQVVEKVAGGRITVLDPFKGRQILPIDTFWADFSGVALFFE
jgi:ABC-type bacteriocin/lantibiotic exporter with double-glycine peptidase domain